MATQAACYDREFFNKYGFFDERLKYIEDLPMCVRMFKQNIPFEYINENAVCHRNDSGISSSKDMFDVKRIAYYQELYTYFTQCLQPVSSRVGRVYVAMRIKICKFRIDYAEALKEKKGKKHQIMLVLRNIVPLCYYMVTNLGGALAHMLHR
ncbi:hypothetical protein SDC9_149700 [bioreactor metagenome]|uniref:Glycosyltransferase 2-like domain-containing protein n=1 Tax=bioreactor metagenome TaxID=1076179 RepID=A0A645EPD6_9ZZZZ